MKDFVKYYTILACIMLAMVSCERKNEPEPGDKTTKRTVLVYMVASNDLGGANCDTNDLEEMKTAVKTAGLNGCRWIIMQKKTRSYPAMFEYRLKNGVVVTDTLKTYKTTVKTTDKSLMKEILTDLTRISPSESYGLVLWSHASGWARDLNERVEQSDFVLKDFGDDSGATMPIDEMAESIPDKMFDFIYADACYMSCVEVAYQLRNKTRYYVASPTELPRDGMPYDKNLPCLVSEKPKLEEACKNTYNYYDSQTGINKTATIALIDCTKLEELAKVCRTIIKESTNTNEKMQMQIQRYKQYKPYLFFDLKHYYTSVTASQQQTKALSEKLDEVVVCKYSTPYIFNSLAINPDNYSGLSTYILGTAGPVNDSYYRTLDWYKVVYGE